MHCFHRLARRVTAALLLATAPYVAADDLVWTGCGVSKQAYMEQLAQAFTTETGIKILMTGGGAAKGIRSVSGGQNQIGGTCRHQLWETNGKMRGDEANAELTQVAWDAIVAIVNATNPVKEISSDNLRKVLRGEITNWKQLGGSDAPIVFIDRETKESGVGHMVRLMLFKDPNVDFAKSTATATKSTESVEEMVEKEPNAIALDGVSSAKKRNVKILALDSVEPSKSNISTGKYPLFRPLYLVTDANAPDPNALKFVDYALSANGQSIIANEGTVNMAEGKALEPLWQAKKTELGIK